MNRSISEIILWAARISGGLVLAFVLFFVLGHIFGDSESGNGFQSAQEIIMFVCFPIATVTGLSLAYKWPLMGGLIASIGFGVFAILDRSAFNFENPYFLLMAFPGALYIVSHLTRKKS